MIEILESIVESIVTTKILETITNIRIYYFNYVISNNTVLSTLHTTLYRLLIKPFLINEI